MKNLVIVGSGGLAMEILWIVQAINAQRVEWNLLGFWDEKSESNRSVEQIPVRRNFKDLLSSPSEQTYFSCGVGKNAIRKRVVEEVISKSSLRPTSIVHPSAIVAPNAQIGIGAIVEPYAVVAPYAKIGEFALINTGCTVGHHSESGHYVQFCPGVRVGGDVKIGDLSFIGSNAVIQPGVEIGSGVTVGAGSFVIRKVANDKTVIGNPAKSLA